MHPALAGKGRELTRLFTRTRRDKVEPAAREAALLNCVCCNPGYGAAPAEEEREDETDDEEDDEEDDSEDLRGFIVRDGEGEETEDEDEDEERARLQAARLMEKDEHSEEEGEDGETGGAREGGGAAAGPSDGAPSQRRQWRNEKADSCRCGQCIRGDGKDNLIELPSSACGGSVDGMGMRHRVHACCLAECLPAEEWTTEETEANYPTCPRCRLLRRQLRLGVGSRAEEAAGEEAAGEAAGEMAIGEGSEEATAKPEVAKQSAEQSAEQSEQGGGGDAEKDEGDLLIGKDVVDANGISLGGLRLSTKLLELRGLLQATPPYRRAAAPPRLRTAALPHHLH